MKQYTFYFGSNSVRTKGATNRVFVSFNCLLVQSMQRPRSSADRYLNIHRHSTSSFALSSYAMRGIQIGIFLLHGEYFVCPVFIRVLLSQLWSNALRIPTGLCSSFKLFLISTLKPELSLIIAVLGSLLRMEHLSSYLFIVQAITITSSSGIFCFYKSEDQLRVRSRLNSDYRYD